MSFWLAEKAEMERIGLSVANHFAGHIAAFLRTFAHRMASDHPAVGALDQKGHLHSIADHLEEEDLKNLDAFCTDMKSAIATARKNREVRATP